MKRLISILYTATLVIGLSFAIAWPLWITATKDRHAYTIAAGVAVASALLFWVSRAVGRGLARAKARRGSLARARERRRGP